MVITARKPSLTCNDLQRGKYGSGSERLPIRSVRYLDLARVGTKNWNPPKRGKLLTALGKVI
jgi:hypothetical protein